MPERVRMKSKTTFDNAFIFNHHKDREGHTTVFEGDEFSTDADHGEQLDRTGLAESVKGDVVEATDRQKALKGTQTTAPGATTTNRVDKVAGATSAKPAA